jgi:hypothetical protein
MGISLKGYSLCGMGERIFSRREGGIFLIFQRIILLVVWDGVFGESKWVFIFCLFFFCDMVT